MRATRAARRSTVAQMGTFAVVSAAVIGALATLLAVIAGGGNARRAVVVSAVVAFGVQLAAFALAVRAVRTPRRPIMQAWVVGTVMRFVAVGVYALVVVPMHGLAAMPALMSLAVFLFLSTLLEPWLLRS